MDPPEKRVIISSVYHKGKLVSQDITVPSDKDVDAIKVAAEIHSIFTNELKQQGAILSHCHSSDKKQTLNDNVPARDPSTLTFYQRKSLFEKISSNTKTHIQSFDSQLEPTWNQQTTCSPVENEKKVISETVSQFHPWFVPSRILDIQNPQEEGIKSHDPKQETLTSPLLTAEKTILALSDTVDDSLISATSYHQQHVKNLQHHYSSPVTLPSLLEHETDGILDRAVDANQEKVLDTIASLQKDVVAHQKVINQLDRVVSEFSSLKERVEQKRQMLIAREKRNAAMVEIHRAKTVSPAIVSSEISHGTVEISNVRLPLKSAFCRTLDNGGFDYYFILLVRSRDRIIPFDTKSTLHDLQGGDLNFLDDIRLDNLPFDFEIAIDLYCLQLTKEKSKGYPNNQQKPNRLRQFLSNTIIGEKIKKGNKRQSMPPVECSRSNLFKRIGSLIITKSNVWRDCFEFNDVPPLFPIEGWFSVQLKCRSDCSIQQRGYLTILQQVVGHVPTLNRKWCLLSEDKLRFWKGYNDEKIKDASYFIDLRKCLQVGPVSPDVCTRPATFSITVSRTETESSCSDENGFCRILSADSREERVIWCTQINKTLINLRAWCTTP